MIRRLCPPSLANQLLILLALLIFANAEGLAAKPADMQWSPPKCIPERTCAAMNEYWLTYRARNDRELKKQRFETEEAARKAALALGPDFEFSSIVGPYCKITSLWRLRRSSP